MQYTADKSQFWECVHVSVRNNLPKIVFNSDYNGVFTRRTAVQLSNFCFVKARIVLISIENVSVCSDSALDYSSVNKWITRFKNDRQSTTDLLRSGRLFSSSTEINKERVETLS